MRHLKVVSNFNEQRVSPVSKAGMKTNKEKSNASFGKDNKEGQSEYRVEKTTGRNIVSK